MRERAQKKPTKKTKWQSEKKTKHSNRIGTSHRTCKCTLSAHTPDRLSTFAQKLRWTRAWLPIPCRRHCCHVFCHSKVFTLELNASGKSFDAYSHVALWSSAGLPRSESNNGTSSIYIYIPLSLCHFLIVGGGYLSYPLTSLSTPFYSYPYFLFLYIPSFTLFLITSFFSFPSIVLFLSLSFPLLTLFLVSWSPFFVVSPSSLSLLSPA